jgi:hypothetical protein
MNQLLRRAFAFPADGRPWRSAVQWWLLAAIFFSGLYAVGAAILLGRTLPPLMLDALCQVFVLAAMLGMFRALPPKASLADKLGICRLREKDIMLVLVMLPVIYLWQFASTALWEKLLHALSIEYQENQALLEWCAAGSWRRYLFMLATIGVMTPAAEELFFRRVIFGLLRPLGMWAALVLTSLIFSSAHLFLHGFPALFGLGAIFQYIYLRSGNLAASVLAHALFNCIALTMVFFTGV